MPILHRMSVAIQRWLVLPVVLYNLEGCGGSLSSPPSEDSPSVHRIERARNGLPARVESARVAGAGSNGCVLRILRLHHPIHSSDGRIRGHVGVDFAVCSNRQILAIGDGVVVEVSSDPGFGPVANGGYLSIVHDVPGGFVRLFIYRHFAHIAVHEGQHVSRGALLGDAWTVDDPEWIPHVHLEQLGREPLDERDPLKTLGSCLSGAKVGQLIYPIPC